MSDKVLVPSSFYESWRISYQSSEQAARAAYAAWELACKELDALRKNAEMIDDAAVDVINLIEGLPPHDWRNIQGMRIKDMPEWVFFYNTVRVIDATSDDD